MNLAAAIAIFIAAGIATIGPQPCKCGPVIQTVYFSANAQKSVSIFTGKGQKCILDMKIDVVLMPENEDLTATNIGIISLVSSRRGCLQVQQYENTSKYVFRDKVAVKKDEVISLDIIFLSEKQQKIMVIVDMSVNSPPIR